MPLATHSALACSQGHLVAKRDVAAELAKLGFLARRGVLGCIGPIDGRAVALDRPGGTARNASTLRVIHHGSRRHARTYRWRRRIFWAFSNGDALYSKQRILIATSGMSTKCRYCCKSRSRQFPARRRSKSRSLVARRQARCRRRCESSPGDERGPSHVYSKAAL